MRSFLRASVGVVLFAIWATMLSAQTQDPVRVPLFRQASQKPLTGARLPESAKTTSVNPYVFDEAHGSLPSTFLIPDVPLPGRGTVSLQCTTMKILSDDAVVAAGTRHGDQERSIDRHILVHGSIASEPGSFVYLAFFRTYAVGYVEIPTADGMKRILFAPDNAEAKEPVMIVYDQADVPNPKHPGCDAENLPDYFTRTQESFGQFAAMRSELKSNDLQNAQTLLARVAVDCDTKYYNQAGSNFSRAANYMIVAVGAVSAVYQRDINVAVQVPYLRIWTENCPYTGDLGSYLNQGRNYWNANMGSVSRTTTFIVTSYTGGLAWVGVLCGSYAYSAAGVTGNTNFPANQYVWDVDVLSHELGHNFGSPHTHNCGWAPPVDSCVNAEGGCYSKPNPRKGTIMSYCHLTSYGTELRFHPRVATLMRASAVRALSSCMRNLASTRPIDIQASSILSPANGSMMKPNTSFGVRGMITNVGAQKAQSIPVTMTITALGGTAPVYTSTRTVASLDAGSSVTISFDSARVAAGTYIVALNANLGGDGDAANNTITRTFQVVSTGASSVDLLYPNGGEQFMSDSTVTIRWKATGTATVLLEFSPDNGVSWTTVRTYQNAADGNTTWKVPAITTRLGLIRIRDMQNADVTDQSAAVFSVDCDRDVQFLEFVMPSSDTTVTAPFVPAVKIRSNGIQSGAFQVQLEMIWRGSGDIVYSRIMTVPFLDMNKEALINFPEVKALPPGQILMMGRVLQSPPDRNPANDTLGRTFNHNGGISPPTGIRAQGVPDAVLLWWGASLTADITGYKITRTTTSGTATDVATVGTSILSYVDDNVKNDTTYTYFVTAIKNTVSSVSTRGADATPGRRIKYDSLQTPRALTPEANAKTVPNPTRFVWSNPKGAQWYQVQIAQGTDMRNVVRSYVVDSETPIALSLTFRQNYCWRVRAFNFNNSTPWSAVNPFTIGTSCAGNTLSFTQASDKLSAPTFEWKSGGAVTVEFWNYVTSTSLAQQNAALRAGPDDATNRFLIHAPFRDGNIYWDYGNINTSGRISTDYKPYLDKWTHVAVVSNGTSFKAIYLDGKLVASSEVADDPKNLTGLIIGISHFGKIDDFRVWNVVRSGEEIYNSMAESLNPGTKNLATYYRLNESLNDTIVADVGYIAAPGYVARKAARVASDAPINCASTATLPALQLVSPADKGKAMFPQPQLSWTAVSSSSSYEVQVSANADFSNLVFATLNAYATAETALGLAPRTTYYWRARAVNSLVTGPWSAVRTFTTDTICPSGVAYLDGSISATVNDLALQAGSAVTIEWWQKVDSADVRTSSAFTIGSKDDAANRCQAHVPWTDRKIYWDFGNINAGGRLVGDYSKSLNKWTHVALVSDGARFKAIYLDGQLQVSEERASAITTLGILRLGQLAGGSTLVKGGMREFRVWNRVRTAEEILRNMNERIDAHPNLLGSWHLDEGLGAVARESRQVDTVVMAAVFSKAPSWKAESIPVRFFTPQISGPDTVRPGDTVLYSSNTPLTGLRAWSVPANTTLWPGPNAWSTYTSWSASDTAVYITLNYTTADGCIATATKKVLVLPLSSVFENSDDFACRVWPNPASGELRLMVKSLGPVRISLRDMLGREITASSADAAGDQEQMIVLPILNVQSGVYLLRCTSGEQMRDVVVHVVR
ncbi:MAG: LamG-like jellyroll fold domain-containing protein [Candidatus Kapaibacterium sp.]